MHKISTESQKPKLLIKPTFRVFIHRPKGREAIQMVGLTLREKGSHPSITLVNLCVSVPPQLSLVGSQSPFCSHFQISQAKSNFTYGFIILK